MSNEDIGQKREFQCNPFQSRDPFLPESFPSNIDLTIEPSVEANVSTAYLSGSRRNSDTGSVSVINSRRNSDVGTNLSSVGGSATSQSRRNSDTNGNNGNLSNVGHRRDSDAGGSVNTAISSIATSIPVAAHDNQSQVISSGRKLSTGSTHHVLDDISLSISSQSARPSRTASMEGRNSAQESKNAIVLEYVQREQELMGIVRKMTEGIAVDTALLETYSHELANYHSVSSDSVAIKFSSSISRGLTVAQANSLIHERGRNELPKATQKPWINVLCRSLFTGFSPLLWIAFIFAVLSSQAFGDDKASYGPALAIVILVVIILSALFTFLHELSFRKTLATFQDLVPPDCIVIRDNTSRPLSPKYLVPGDVVVLEIGMRVPADLRMISSKDMMLDKSILTGENDAVKVKCEPVSSKISMLQASNIALMGCTVVEGEGLGLVIATGLDTQLAKIAEQIGDYPSSRTYLQKEISKFSLRVSFLAALIVTALVLEWIFYLHPNHQEYMSLPTLVRNAVAVLIALIPEALPLSLETGLLTIARRLRKDHNVLIKQLGIIESLGSLNFLASDKTGTLTMNALTPTEIIAPEGTKTIDYLTRIARRYYHKDFCMTIIQIFVLCNQSKLIGPFIDSTFALPRKAVGSNTVDKSLLEWVEKTVLGVVEGILENNRRVLILPFTSESKRTIVLVDSFKSEGFHRVLMKGAPEIVLEQCSTYTDEITYEMKPMTTEIKQQILHNIAISARQGRRVLALAEGCLPPDIYPEEYVFKLDPLPNFPTSGLTFIACVALSDPPRPGVAETISTLREAGIRVSMVTGDSIDTAIAIAKQVGIISNASVIDHNITSSNHEEALSSNNLTANYNQIRPIDRDQNAANNIEPTRPPDHHAIALRLAGLDSLRAFNDFERTVLAAAMTATLESQTSIHIDENIGLEGLMPVKGFGSQVEYIAHAPSITNPQPILVPESSVSDIGSKVELERNNSDRIIVATQRSSSFTFLGASIPVPKHPSNYLGLHHNPSFNEFSGVNHGLGHTDIYSDHMNILEKITGVNTNVVEDSMIPGYVVNDAEKGVVPNKEGYILSSQSDLLSHDNNPSNRPSHRPSLSEQSSTKFGIGQLYHEISSRVPFISRQSSSRQSSRASRQTGIDVADSGKSFSSNSVSPSSLNSSFGAAEREGWDDYPLPPDHPSRKTLNTYGKSHACVIDGDDLVRVSPLGWNFIFNHKEIVFARTTPEQKLSIVIEAQNRGYRVGVTGDGINDSPALKIADAGIAMGVSGADVARDAANVVLLDDNFSSVCDCVEQGRLVYVNLRKTIAYLISGGCWAELVPTLSAFILGIPRPLSPFLMIIISCAVDVLGGMYLMNEYPERELILEQPKHGKLARLVSIRLVVYSYLYMGSLHLIGAFLNYFLYMNERGPNTLSSPLPSDDDGNITNQRVFPAGYSPYQLLFAWNWDYREKSLLSLDQNNAQIVASSVFFTTLVCCQISHLLTIRRKNPYFFDWYMNRSIEAAEKDNRNASNDMSENQLSQSSRRYRNEGSNSPRGPQLQYSMTRGIVLNSQETNDTEQINGHKPINQRPVKLSLSLTNLSSSLYDSMRCCVTSLFTIFRYIRANPPSIQLLGTIIAAIIITNIFNELPRVHKYCGTGSVPARYWGIAIGWAGLCCLIDQGRKWIIMLYPNSWMAKASWELEN